MIKILKNIKGFAMAELLAICIVILVIFSILFSNYLPLLAEYEKRISYNDVTAQYAAHYVRKMYYNAFSDPTNGLARTNLLDTTLNNYGFYTVWNNEKNIDTITGSSYFSSDNQTKLKNLINAYGIEEIIITKYQLKDSGTTYVKGKYNEGSGSLYNYINYLPNYEKSIYTGTNSEENMQLYRIILKTKDYGYATTPIFYDYKTPSSCFTAKQKGPDELQITGYNMEDDEECGEIVTISNKRLTISGHTGYVVAIGDEAFKDKKITEVIYNSSKIKTIGDRAFQGTNLIKFDLEGLTSVGEAAFSKINTLKEITIPNGVHFGDGAFRDNPYLSKINIEANGIITKDGITEPEGLFENCANGIEGEIAATPISVETKGLTSIPKAMFMNSNVKGITFGNNLTNIGGQAFFQDDNIIKEFKSYTDNLEFPTSLISIGEKAFKNFGLNITSLNFDNFTNDISIGGGAFEGITVKTIKYPPEKEEPKQNNKGISELIITDRLTYLGSSAFANAGIKTLNLNLTSASQLTTIGDYTFRKNTDLNSNITLEIPSTITKIRIEAFAETSLAKGIILPENLATIGTGAFRGTALKSITIPKNITSLPNDAFNTASSLKEIVVPNNWNLTKIGNRAFQNTAIEKFTIPSSVTSIGENAFFGCTELAKNEGDFINNSNVSVKWCDIFATDTVQNQILSCTESTSGNLVTMVYKTKDAVGPQTKYITDGSGE